MPRLIRMFSLICNCGPDYDLDYSGYNLVSPTTRFNSSTLVGPQTNFNWKQPPRTNVY
jgi:hypothetical protein